MCTACHECATGSVAILSINGRGYTRPLLPWYTRFSRNMGFRSGSAGMYVGIVTASCHTFTAPVSAAGGSGSPEAVRLRIASPECIFVIDFRELRALALLSCTRDSPMSPSLALSGLSYLNRFSRRGFYDTASYICPGEAVSNVKSRISSRDTLRYSAVIACISLVACRAGCFFAVPQSDRDRRQCSLCSSGAILLSRRSIVVPNPP